MASIDQRTESTSGSESRPFVVAQGRDTNPGFRLSPPTFLPRRYKPRNVGEWTGHLTFASDLIVALEPSLIVELGTHWGEAYFTFCQTVQEHGLSTLCYAVDHWLGDDHAGHYGEEVFEEVSQYNHRLYRQFSYLLRRSFDEGVTQFADQSIDLLHIDGLHTYEAVLHDFRAWLPKIRPGGVVLLHDICPRHQDFGVWRLWDEIKAQFPHTFEFHHSWGLGVVRVDGGANQPTLLELLFESSPQVGEDLRRHYVIYASHLEHILGRMPSLAAPRPEIISEIRVEVFPWVNGRHSSEFCQVRKMAAGCWNTLIFDLRDPQVTAPLRIDPGCEPSFIEVGDILIHSSQTGELVWKSEAALGNSRFQLGGTALAYSNDPSLILSVGDDPNFSFSPPGELHGPLTLAISLKVAPVPKAAMELIHGRLLNDVTTAAHKIAAIEQERSLLAHERDTLRQQRDALTQDRDGLTRERDALTQERDAVTQERDARTQQRDAVTQERDALTQEQAALTQERAALADELRTARSELSQLTSQRNQELTQLNNAMQILTQIQNSTSWRVTSPLRRIMAMLRGKS